MSNPHTLTIPNRLKTLEQNKYAKIWLKHKNQFMNPNLVCKRLKLWNIWKVNITQIIMNKEINLVQQINSGST